MPSGQAIHQVPGMYIGHIKIIIRGIAFTDYIDHSVQIDRNNQLLPMKSEPNIDVIVVGAGVAGLWAALTLRDAGKSVVILEANDRVGGRLKGGVLDGKSVDLGGQWVGKGQDHSYRVAERYGMDTYVTPTFGNNILELDGEIYTEENDPEVFERVVRSPYKVIEQWVEKIHRPGFWDSEDTLAWDRSTTESWLNQNIEDVQARAYLTTVIRGFFTKHPCQLSMLDFFSSFIEQTIDEELRINDGALQHCFKDGFFQLALHMAAELDQDELILQSPVRSVSQDSSSVTVVSDKITCKAQRVIITAPPPVATRIDFTPPLPFTKSGCMERMPMGSIIKCLIAYPTPFWRNQGYSGHGNLTSTITNAFQDITPPDYTGGILAGFIGGDTAMIWSDTTKQKRCDQVKADLASVFGRQAHTPQDYIENVWPLEPWIEGGYSCSSQPGSFSVFGDTLAHPCGRIHWAGTETAEINPGYVDGALRSSERAAKEVLACL